MAEMTKERAEIIDLKRKLRAAREELESYRARYIELLESRSR